MSDGRCDNAVTFSVESGENIRLDVYLASETDYTRSRLKRLIDGGDILVNGEVCKCGRILKEGDFVTLTVPTDNAELPKPKDIPLDVIFEDDDIIVVNKQQGLTVHPGAGNGDTTLVNALLWRGTSLSDVNGAYRPGIVHRLDKYTSGVMVVAKNNVAHASLAKQFTERTVKKVYVAILDGNLKDDKGLLTTFIGRNPNDRKTMAVTKEGRVAITEYKVLERFPRNCVAEFVLHTGRTHQIRVHSKYLGAPVLGDKVYGSSDKRYSSLEGQLLHSRSLTITHPKSGEKMTLTAAPPEEFTRVYDSLKKQSIVGRIEA